MDVYNGWEVCFVRVIVDRLRLNTAGTHCLTTVPLAVALNRNRRTMFVFCSPYSNVNSANSEDIRGESCVLFALQTRF